MKQAKYAIVSMVFAVTVGCTTQLLPATPPPLETEVLPIYHTGDTQLLVTTANQHYEADYNVLFEQHSDNHQNLLIQLDPNSISYFLSHHNSVGQNPELWSAPLVQDGIALIIHPDNPVRNLSIEELRRVYRGFVSNWSELGGQDADIAFYSREEGAAIRLEFDRLVMGQQQTSPNAQVLSSSDLVIERVASDLQGIGYIPLSLLNDETQALAIETILPSLTSLADNSYPLRSTVYVIGLQEPSNAYREFFIWIQNSGQEALSSVYAPLPR